MPAVMPASFSSATARARELRRAGRRVADLVERLRESRRNRGSSAGCALPVSIGSDGLPVRRRDQDRARPRQRAAERLPRASRRARLDARASASRATGTAWAGVMRLSRVHAAAFEQVPFGSAAPPARCGRRGDALRELAAATASVARSTFRILRPVEDREQVRVGDGEALAREIGCVAEDLRDAVEALAERIDADASCTSSGVFGFNSGPKPLCIRSR